MKLLSIFLMSFLLLGCETIAELQAKAAAPSTPTVTIAMPEQQQQENDLSDDDADGVITYREQCLNSVLGSQVNNSGCGGDTVNTVRQELNVNFGNNSAVISARYFADIKGLADFMTRYPDLDVIIEGHSSKQGSAALNMDLSQRRAQAVMDLLINKFGITTSRVSAIGYGFERLLDEGNSKSAHKRNRRIVAELSGENLTQDMKWTIYSVDKTL
ncbi:OmpA family protein [Moritella sp. Urea-trap-13]|uniref:OmpA family protein n=1 Tax=Moritella sp. Urea-trap-13 TaxID=2058327 RepID=UPI000C334678|nr:OmpA family protein [Moritella sp. Urea-trap-13]PKH05612.1 OmpA family protein [Moritella sp. Urea-trap-13]